MRRTAIEAVRLSKERVNRLEQTIRRVYAELVAGCDGAGASSFAWNRSDCCHSFRSVFLRTGAAAHVEAGQPVDPALLKQFVPATDRVVVHQQRSGDFRTAQSPSNSTKALARRVTRDAAEPSRDSFAEQNSPKNEIQEILAILTSLQGVGVYRAIGFGPGIRCRHSGAGRLERYHDVSWVFRSAPSPR